MMDTENEKTDDVLTINLSRFLPGIAADLGMEPQKAEMIIKSVVLTGIAEMVRYDMLSHKLYLKARRGPDISRIAGHLAGHFSDIQRLLQGMGALEQQSQAAVRGDLLIALEHGGEVLEAMRKCIEETAV